MSFYQLGTKIPNHKYEYQLDRTSHYIYLVLRSHILASFKPCFTIAVYVTVISFITQAVTSGFRFRPSFFLLRSVTNRCLVSRAHAYATWNLQKR